MTRSQSVIVVLGGFLVLWEAWVRIAGVPVYFLPAPSAIFLEIAQDPSWYARHSAYTVGACLLGFAMALVIGIAAAIGIVYSKVLENTLYTFLVSLNSIPKIALAPLFIIWMGTNLSSKVAISMLIALFAVVIDTVLGLRSVDPDVLDMAKSMRARPLQVLWKIRFPSALPAMFAGFRISAGLSVVGEIVGGFFFQKGPSDLGILINTCVDQLNTGLLFGAVFASALLGVIVFWLFTGLGRLIYGSWKE